MEVFGRTVNFRTSVGLATSRSEVLGIKEVANFWFQQPALRLVHDTQGKVAGKSCHALRSAIHDGRAIDARY